MAIHVESINNAFINRTDNKMVASITSYEIVCATACRAPNNAYFAFKAHSTQPKNSTPGFMLNGYGMGNGIHIVRAKVRARIGAIIHTLMMVMVAMVL